LKPGFCFQEIEQSVKRGLLILFCLFFVLAAVLFWLASPDLQLMARPNRIGIIEVTGIISDARKTMRDIVKFRKDSNVRAIVLRVESPGGGVGPSQELYREVMRTKDTKPVIASLGSVAASGGYYVASPASWIMASSGTVTGSIGVVMYYPNMQELLQKIGLSMTAIKSGQYKDLGNPDREMAPEEIALLQRTIDEVHQQFIRDIAQGRELPQEKIRAIADGRIMTGESARTAGLIDEIGNFQDAVQAAASMGKIEGEPKLVYAKKEGFSLLDLILGSDLSTQLKSYGTLSGLRYQAPFGP
jgi:protease IV